MRFLCLNESWSKNGSSPRTKIRIFFGWIWSQAGLNLKPCEPSTTPQLETARLDEWEATWDNNTYPVHVHCFTALCMQNKLTHGMVKIVLFHELLGRLNVLRRRGTWSTSFPKYRPVQMHILINIPRFASPTSFQNIHK